MLKMINKILLFIFLSFAILGCERKKQIQLLGSSWYLFKSTDPVRESEKIFKYFHLDSDNTLEFQHKNYLKVLSFSEGGTLSEFAFNPKYGLFPVKQSTQGYWRSENDTLWIDEQAYLIKNLSHDSLVIQQIEIINNGIVLSGIDTYYRIAISKIKN